MKKYKVKLVSEANPSNPFMYSAPTREMVVEANSEEEIREYFKVAKDNNWDTVRLYKLESIHRHIL